MSRSHVRWVHPLVLHVMLVAGLAAVGCNQPGGNGHWVKNGLLDPTQTGNFDKPVRIEIRDTVSILDEPPGIEEAEEPTEEDLMVRYEEPIIGPGDFLKITIFELLGPGISTEQQFQVKATGYETFPALGPVKVTGTTSRGLELALKEVIREAGILEDADVQVTVLRYESLQYSVVGGVSQPGNFPLPRPNFRLMNALATSGGLPPQAETVIVIRDGAKKYINGYVPAETQPAEPSSFGERREPSEEVSYTMFDAPQQGVAGAAAATDTRPADQAPVDELEILEGRPRKPADSATPVYNAETGQWELLPAGATTTAATSAPEQPSDDVVLQKRASTEPAVDAPGSDVIDDLLLSDVRVLEIPAKALREGDPRYNIVIRPSDLIDVPIGDIGEFYMYGNVARPGAYQLTGRRITVKQAIASAGGFGPLAWPSRADLIRRVGKDEEQFIQIDLDAIFAGTAPDFYLRPNDIVNVGSSPVSVFLAVVRNAFRFSYGFGFVYDRNFADSDTFFAKEQVKQRRNLEAQQRGLPF